ncbi:MAG: NAD-dependent epimerase/dehydratase family protein [Pirellulales bacterium]|nr:NAD-dependent epimerase/dehydratase family protein [Pirellulales bacterium]
MDQSINIRGKRIFITGGAGFIGSTLAGRLLDENDVTIYDDFRRDSLSTRPFADHPRLKIVKGNVLDAEHVVTSIGDANIVIHCAAIAGIDTVILRPTETLRVNILGTANVLEAARGLPNLERLVTFSTSEVFGQAAFRADEADTAHIGAVGEARWTYAVGKLADEHFAQAYHQEFDMPTVIVRPFNVYGPGQVGEGAMRTFVIRALAGDEIQIHGDGNQIRAWCYVDDMIEGIMLALTEPAAVGEAFNIGNARAVITIYGLAQTVVRVLGSSSKIRFIPKDYADVELRVPSVRKAKELIGFDAKVDLEEGILRTAEYYKG